MEFLGYFSIPYFMRILMIVMKFVTITSMTNASISMYDKSMLKYKRHENKEKEKEIEGTKVCMACGFLRSRKKI